MDTARANRVRINQLMLGYNEMFVDLSLGETAHKALRRDMADVITSQSHHVYSSD